MKTSLQVGFHDRIKLFFTHSQDQIISGNSRIIYQHIYMSVTFYQFLCHCFCLLIIRHITLIKNAVATIFPDFFQHILCPRFRSAVIDNYKHSFFCQSETDLSSYPPTCSCHQCYFFLHRCSFHRKFIFHISCKL